MKIEIVHSGLMEILPLRNLFLQENNFQIRYNASHERGWSDIYKIAEGDKAIGYGALKSNDHVIERTTIFEFYIIPSYRDRAAAILGKLLLIAKAAFIECQSNDLLLTSLLYQYGKNITANVVLFEENTTSRLAIDKIVFRRRHETDLIFGHEVEPVGDFVLEMDKEVVATGGFLLHYNKPFADLYMEVRGDQRRKGLGSFLIQEIKKQCYLSGRVPAARCDIKNIASRATLIKAGLKVAGFMLFGVVES